MHANNYYFLNMNFESIPGVSFQQREGKREKKHPIKWVVNIVSKFTHRLIESGLIKKKKRRRRESKWSN